MLVAVSFCSKGRFIMRLNAERSCVITLTRLLPLSMRVFEDSKYNCCSSTGLVTVFVIHCSDKSPPSMPFVFISIALSVGRSNEFFNSSAKENKCHFLSEFIEELTASE